LNNIRFFAGIAILLFASACATGSNMSSGMGGGPKDGELKFPAGYDTFPRFISGIQKPAHVRDLFINKTGASAQKGQAFANGSILVMEIYNAKKDGGGYVTKRPDGRNAKDNLAKVFIMQKGAGWGKNAPSGLQTGDWIFSAFSANGTPVKVNYTKCRQCHLPLKDKDFVHRYDEYFVKRGM
jgi:hypothetical protein